MKRLFLLFLLAGLNLFFYSDLYGQSAFERSKKGYENSALKKKMDAHVAKSSASDPFYRLNNSPRKINRCTTEYMYTISVSTPGGSYTLYYGENEKGTCDTDYRALNGAKSVETVRQSNGRIKNPNYRGGSLANNDWNANQADNNWYDNISAFSNDEMKGNAGENILELPSARNQHTAASNSTTSGVSLNFDDMEAYFISNSSSEGIQIGDGIMRPREDYPNLPETKFIKTATEKEPMESQSKNDEKLQLWNKIFEDINNKQRFTTIINQLITLNSGEIPIYMGFENNAYIFKDKDGESYFFVNANGTYMEKVTTKELKLDGSFSGSLAGVDVEISKNRVELSSEEKSQIKNWGDAYKDNKDPIWLKSGIELKGKFTSYGIETTEISINEDGSAKKKVITIDGPSIGGSGNLKLNDVGIECNASLASAKAYLSYVQSPKLDVNNLYGSLNIHQQEIGIIIGADAGVKGKVAVGKKGAEASAIVTVGIGWENHETKQNFNQLPKSITNRVYLDYLDDRNSIFYSKTMDSNWADNRGNSIRGTYHNASEQDIEKATEKTRDELLSSPKE